MNTRDPFPDLEEPRMRIGMAWYTIIVHFEDGSEQLAWCPSMPYGFQSPSKVFLQRFIDEGKITPLPPPPEGGMGPGILMVKMIDKI